MELGADYSWARPGGAALHAAGVKAVGRYLASDGRGITAAEYADLKAHGVGVWLVREGAASGMLGGWARGVADARVAVQQIAAVGLPADSVVYAAADWDVTAAQFAPCDDYLRGFASVLGLSRTGIYGGLHYLNHAHAAGLAVAFWQAGATSWNHGERPQMRINYEQTTRTPPLPGTDHNFIYTSTPAVVAPSLNLGDKMIRIQSANRGIALIGAGFFRQLVTDEEVAASEVLMEKHVTGNDRQFDLWRSMALGVTDLVADIHKTVTQPVKRDGVNVSQADDNAATGTLARALVAQVGSVSAAVNSVTTAGGVDPAAIQSAAQAGSEAGASKVLSGLTLKAAQEA